MTKRYNLGLVEAIPFGEGRNYKVGDKLVAVFRSRDGALFATQATCPHRKGPLADGLVGGQTLVCPLHEWSFDLATGKTLNGTCDLAVYSVAKSPSDELLLEMPGEHDTN
ncbi:MAG TPA: Rieske 2Fe-2S domain-containing protein [Polyangiales bacterium]|nr:Rieske 2Fe-2S domain-containing protein [Polyangiales bacterium]